ncbi:MAG: ABC transporter permease, partial [Deltaproteobacteria bacterium]|nr:ABC transporter permease [Candidatus Desulfobacula maris]
MNQIIAPLFSIYRHSTLLKGFVVKDIKGRFAGTFAGLFWTFLGPISRILAYFFVFSMVLRVTVTIEETGTDKFVIFFLCGFFPWTMFAESLSNAIMILINESRIITKVVFPVELLPVSVVISNFLINGIGFGFFLVYLGFKGYFNSTWLLLPLFLIFELMFALGLSFFLSAMCVFIRDLGELFSIVIMLWFFGTPVIYPASMVPESLAFIFNFNPMVYVVDVFRSSILMGQVKMGSLIALAAFSLVS